MNSLFLVAALALAFVFGYRFYAKLLALDVFRLHEHYNTPAHARADGHDYVPTHPQLLFGHHLAATTGAAAFAAPLVALGWGWVPAFLWITVGSAVAAGTYALGSFWLTVRDPRHTADSAAMRFGRHARPALFALMLVAALILVAAAAGFTGLVLARFPGAVLPLIAVGALAFALGSYLHGRSESELLPACAAALFAALLAVWLLGRAPLAFEGSLALALGGRVWLALDGTVVWVVLALVYALLTARLPVWKLSRPRAFLTALLLLLLLVLFYAALFVAHPALVAPEFHMDASGRGALPGMFLLVGVGALAGWQLLIVHGVTGRELRRESDARYVGYGSALVQGLAALSALLLGAVAFATPEEWSAHYAALPSAGELPAAAVFYVNALARHLGALGLDAASARNFAATVLAGLSLALLEAGVRALGHLLADAFPVLARRRTGTAGRHLWLIVAAAAVIALHDGTGLGGIALWPLLAMTSLWLAAAGFAHMAAGVRNAAQPPLLPALLSAAVGVIAASSTAAQLWAWWRAGAWPGVVAGLVITLLAAAWLGEAARAARAWRPRAELDT